MLKKKKNSLSLNPYRLNSARPDECKCNCKSRRLSSPFRTDARPSPPGINGDFCPKTVVVTCSNGYQKIELVLVWKLTSLALLRLLIAVTPPPVLNLPEYYCNYCLIGQYNLVKPITSGMYFIFEYICLGSVGISSSIHTSQSDAMTHVKIEHLKNIDW